jgi:hypothetical protein
LSHGLFNFQLSPPFFVDKIAPFVPTTMLFRASNAD